MAQITHRIEWNGRENIVVLENGHDRIDVPMDEMIDLVAGIIARLASPQEREALLRQQLLRLQD